MLKEGFGKDLGDKVLVSLGSLLASLGRVDELRALDADVGDRILDGAELSARWRETVEALAERVGHPVEASVVWRLLARHGWRKVAPDTRHPKNDPQVMQACKKNSPRSREALLCRRAV